MFDRKREAHPAPGDGAALAAGAAHEVLAAGAAHEVLAAGAARFLLTLADPGECPVRTDD